MMMKAIIFDAFGTLFKVTNGGSAKTIMRNITVWVDRNGIGGNSGHDYKVTDLNGLFEVLRD